MVKRVLVITLSLFLGFASIAFAADPLYRMTNPEYFPGDQDAMLLGQITGIEDEFSTISVLKVLNGSLESDNIQVEGSFTYLGFSPEHFDAEVGDFCIIAIKKYNDIYRVLYPDRAVRADSGDYKTLKCLYESVHYQGGDVPAIQWYVNSGGTENGFAFGSGRAYVDRPNGERVDITNISQKVTFDDNGTIFLVEDTEIPNPSTSSSINSKLFLFILIAIGLSLTAIRNRNVILYGLKPDKYYLNF